MLLDFARKTYVRSAILFCTALVFLWLKQIIFGETIPIEREESVMPLTDLLYSFISSPLLESVYVILITLISAAILMVIVPKHDLLRGYDYLSAFIFILLSLSFPIQKQVSGVHLAVLFCLSSLNRLLCIYNRTEKSGNIYLSTLYVGIAGLFYPPALLFLPIFLISIALLKVFNWRDFFLGISGTITPFIFAASYYHVLGKDILQPINTIIYFFTPSTSIIDSVRFEEFNIGYLYFGYIALLIFIATISNVRGISANIKKSRMLGILRLLIGFLLAAVIIFPAMQTPFMLTLMAASAAILITSYLSGIRRVKIANIQLILLIISCILPQFYF